MKVLISVDGSKIAEAAFDWYVQNFHKPENEIVVGHILERPPGYQAYFAGGAVSSKPKPELKEPIADDVQQAFEALKLKFDTKLKGKGIKYKLAFETTQDSIGEAIIQMIQRENCAVIVTGSRGMGKIKRAIFGSVSDYVMHKAKIPVLIYNA